MKMHKIRNISIHVRVTMYKTEDEMIHRLNFLNLHHKKTDKSNAIVTQS